MRFFIFITLFFQLFCSNFSYAEAISFSEEEQTYIMNNPTIVIGIDPEFRPYEFVDTDGNYVGMVADYLRAIEEKTGLTFKRVEDVSWAEAYDLALAGNVDLLPCVGITDQRKEAFLFTDSYLSFQRVLLSNDESENHNFDQLDGVRVGVQRNSSNYYFMAEEMNAELLMYDTLEELLLALSSNDIHLAVGNYASSRYMIKQLGLSNIVVSDVYEDVTSELAMAVTNDNVILQSILNKSLASITEEERIVISNKWLGIIEKADYTNIFIGVSIIVVIALVVIVMFSSWNVRLRREIHLREETEKQLIKAKVEAEKAYEVKSLFIANMSHEIRTPMNGVIGFGKLLEKTALNEKQRSYLDKINESSDHLMEIINDILDFSNLESGNFEVESAVFDFDRVLEDVIGEAREKAAKKRLKFTVDYDQSIPNRLIGDSYHLHQILENVLDNAVKFTEMGEVCLALSLEQLSGEDAKIKFLIKDTGIGMSGEQCHDLFEAFSQADISSTRKFGGIGLGLAIVQNLVSVMEGNVAVRSTLEQGTEFDIILPFKVDLSEASAAFVPQYIKGIKIAMISDNPSVVESIKMYLSDMTQSIDVFNDLGVFQAAYERQYELIFLDCSINQLSDVACKAIYKFITESSMEPSKVVLMADDHTEDIETKARSAGFKTILKKPITASTFFDTIITMLSYRKAEDLSKNIKTGEKIFTGIKVLLVEDNLINQEIAKENLEDEGAEVIIANNGAEALEIVAQPIDFDIVLMDLQMPVMGGREATQKIRETFSSEMLPIIALSADIQQRTTEEIMKIGMQAHVKKPIHLNELYGVMARLLKITFSEEASSNLTNTKNSEYKFEEMLKSFNTIEGIMRLGGNEKLYLKIASQFATMYADFDEKMITEAHQMTSDALMREFHTLKGLSASLGNDEVSEYSNRLELRFKNGTLAPALLLQDRDFEGLITCLSHGLGEIKALENSVSSEPVIEDIEVLDEDVFAAAFKTLVELLDSYDVEAQNKLREMKGNFIKNGWMDEYHKIEEASEAYDFEIALEILGTLNV
jgi:signal transduction histidine kinase/DNA-binding response OmpR family regulator/HPt (histidine-containing phosphotransfer) domain-containing protein